MKENDKLKHFKKIVSQYAEDSMICLWSAIANLAYYKLNKDISNKLSSIKNEFQNAVELRQVENDKNILNEF